MDAIQEKIDENRDQMPVALAKQLLDMCKAQASKQPRYYRMLSTHVTAFSYVDADDDPTSLLKTFKQTRIVELKGRSLHTDQAFPSIKEWIDLGFFDEKWLSWDLPHSIEDGSSVLVIHSIAPASSKRARD